MTEISTLGQPTFLDAPSGRSAKNPREDATPLLLIYASSLQSSDGTTIQLRRLLADAPFPVWHIHGPSPAAFPDLPNGCLSLQIRPEPRYPFRKGAGFVRRTWRRWYLPRSARLQIAQACRRQGATAPRTAYVVVYDEHHAGFAHSVLRAAGIDRYVLHMMDLFHARFDPRSEPALAKLVANASAILAVSRRLANEIAPVARRPIEILPLVAGFVRPSAPPVAPPVPYLMMSGALYAADPFKLRFLYESVLPAWRELLCDNPGIAWRYSGANASSFSPALRAVITNCGLLPQAAWCEMLAGARCALLPVIHHHGDHFRYSVPSRLVDYLAAGVPVIAPSSPNTATEDFLRSFSNRGVIIADTTADVHAALKRLFFDDAFHRSQVAAALSVASGFSFERTQRRLFEVLHQVAS